MKRNGAFRAAVWWVMLCLIAGIFVMVTSDKGETVSDTENRKLQAFPKLSASSVVSDEFMQDMETFLLDKFTGRDAVIGVSNGLINVFSIEHKDASEEMEARLDAEENGGEEETEVLDSAEQVVEESAETTDAEDTAGFADEEAEPEEEGDLEITGELPITDNASYFWLDKSDGTRKKVRTYKKTDVASFADTLVTVRNLLPEDGRVFFTQVPLASTANKLSDSPNTYTGWGSTAELMLNNVLAERGVTGVKAYNTPEILASYMTGSTPLFYHTDHHWSTEGAYLVFAEMTRDRGLPVTAYDDYRYKALKSDRIDGYTDVFNALYPLYPVESRVVTELTKNETVDLMDYSKRNYRCLMNGTRYPWRRIISGAGTGRQALVICDSFGNAFTPYLLAYYDEVHMCDFRKGRYKKQEAGGNIGELIQYYGIDDVYIICCTANDMTKENLQVYLPGHLTY